MNRPKLEFVPKTLADLHIEGILNHGRRYGSSLSLSRPSRQPLPPSSSVGDLSTVDPLKAWDSPGTKPGIKRRPAGSNDARLGYSNSTRQTGSNGHDGVRPGFNRDATKPAGFMPHPAPRNPLNGLRDPWTGDFGFYLLGFGRVLLMVVGFICSHLWWF